MSQIQVSEMIEQFINEYIDQWDDIFLVEVTVKKGSNKTIVLLDGDHGLNIDKCAEVNRALYKYVEEQNLFGEENFSIEVSSPGIDKPLKLLRQYKKNIGRKVQVTLNDESVMEGQLLTVDDDEISIGIEPTKKNKKTEKQITNIPFSEIRQVKVLVSF